MRLDSSTATDDDDEKAPMLPSPASRQVSADRSAHKIPPDIHQMEIGEPEDPKSPPSSRQSTLTQYIRSRFSWLYLVISILALVIVAVLVVVLILLYTMYRMDDKYEKHILMAGENGTQSEMFMRLYEEIHRFRTSPQMTINSILSHLTPEQIFRAKAAGILPLDEPSHSGNFTAPSNIPPIVPISVGTSLDDATTKVVEAPFRSSWHKDSTCSINCKKHDIAVPPLLIISLDGFSREYLDRKLVPSLDAFGECGARAKLMYPSYASKTFPNHYTIATGLYPEAHGIVDNVAFDPTISDKMEDMKRTKHAEFYGGEPIWSAAVRQHRRVYCLFWPGCTFNITNAHSPTLDVPYNKSLSYSSRVDMIVNWLLLPLNERPSLVMAYFDQPDSVGHFHTNDHQVNLELEYIGSLLDYLFTSLYKHSLFDCINVVVVSDHGMQFLNKRYYLNEMIDTKGMLIANGPIGRIYMHNSNMTTDSIIDSLECTASEYFHVYDRSRLPRRYHYSKGTRVGDVILDGQAGTTFYQSRANDYHVTSDHGFDFIDESMHAIFFARGPNIRPGVLLAPFQNIELFNLFTDLLRLTHDVPNNGTLGVLDDAIHKIQLNRPISLSLSQQLRPVQECSPLNLFQKREMRACTPTPCPARAALDGCQLPLQPIGIFYTDAAAATDCCFINLCSIAVLTRTAPPGNLRSPTVVFETLSGQESLLPPNLSCPLVDARFDNCHLWMETVAKAGKMEWHSIMGSSQNELQHLNRLQFLLYKEFASGPFTYLQNLTSTYVKKYKRLLTYTGTIFDYDMDGLADGIDMKWSPTADVKPHYIPSHIFRIIMRCDDGAWHINGLSCRNGKATRVLTFILPNQPGRYNCMNQSQYLLKNTARVRDVELLTNVYFFAERMWYGEAASLQWRTNITSVLWD